MAEHLWSFVRSVDIGDAEVLWPHDLAHRFDESELAGQFRLSESSSQMPTGWQRDQIGSWHLVHDPTLPVMRLIGPEVPVGWILGHPVNADGVLLTEDLEVGAQGRVLDVGSVEDLLDDLAGRFVAIIVGLDTPRVYLDALGSMGVVFSVEQKMVASSVFLIPYSGDDDDRIGFVSGSGPLRPPHLYFGLTVRASVDWLLPDHYLNLSTWQTVRHWPRKNLAFTTETGEVVEFVAERLRRNIGAIVETGRIRMSLTAGRDTRVLLACARDFISDIEFVSDVHSDRRGYVDVSVARHIARTMGLHHKVIRRPPVTDSDLARFLYRTGGVAAADARSQETVSIASRTESTLPHVAGNAGEMDRMPVYFPLGDEPEPLTILSMLELRKQLPFPEVVERGARWFADLPVDNPYTVLDLRVLEMRIGGWGGFLGYGHCDMAKFIFLPFADRRVLEALMSLPVSFRREYGVVNGVISSGWPELLSLPFNDVNFGPYGRYRRARKLAKRVLRR